MSLTITLSGVYRDPEAQPLPGVTLIFESVYNTSQTQLQTAVKIVTGEYAEYTISLVPDTYNVSEVSSGRKKYLGCIQIFADSPDGTLNEYLTSFKPDQIQPGILAEMEEILQETKEAAANAGFNPRGQFEPTAAYQKNDLVEYDGSEYLATEDVTGIAPPESPWQLFVARGADGKDGTDGENGSPNTLTVTDVQTLPAGEPATVEISGESPNQSLSFGIPQGRDGLDGKNGNDGENGTDGESAYQIWLDAGNTGSEADFLASLQGEPGEDGADGQNGPPNILTIGEVTTAPAGEPAAAEITGDAPDQTLNLTLPQGEEGPAGESAYQIWLDAGNSGTEADFLASLEGGDGQDGADGEPGPPNTLTIGTVGTVPPGTGSSATITGDSPNQILNLSLEQGEKGDSGDSAVASVNGKTGAVELTSQDIFNAPEEVGLAQDLNDYVYPGLYIQSETSGASGGQNYPEGQAGALTVISTGNGNVIQTYQDYYNTKTFKRAFRNNTWTAWYAVYDELNPPPEQTLPALGMPGSSGMFTITDSSIVSLHPGDPIAGSKIKFAGINDGTGLVQSYAGFSLAGTWEARGYFYSSPTGAKGVSGLIRIDGTNLMSATHLLQAVAASDRIRSCRYSTADNSTIDCEVLVSGKWYPFTASSADSTKWGLAIYNAAVAGQFGEVAPYLV